MKQTKDAVQLLGGRGYLKGYDVERFVHDAEVTQIYNGTSQIQKVVMARHALAGAALRLDDDTTESSAFRGASVRSA